MSLLFSGPAQSVICNENLDEALSEVPNRPAVFAIWAEDGLPYLGRAGDLRRRLKRLLRKREVPGRLLNLRAVAQRILYWCTASNLESLLVLYECARLYLPDTYSDLLRLKVPWFVRLPRSNPFPRLQVGSRLTASGATYGPFRTRALADQFEHDLLDLFQLRRCPEDLQPSPDHPGCIYGEMNMCLRPCQEVVSVEEYVSEARRVTEFLYTSGKSALTVAEFSRDRLSEELQFEAAAREHERAERIRTMLRLQDELAREVSQSCGVAVLPSASAHNAVVLWFLAGGAWQKPLTFTTGNPATGSLDRDLRELIQLASWTDVPLREKEEHLAILGRWYWSSWRDGIWIRCESPDRIPYRRLVTAVSKVVHQSAAVASDSVKKGATEKL
ncbi:MAG: hypothetical protein H7039_06345 [Bryobacteraceae bacterium]|nr:hypothetical protein [Bryobacteraceae bacterium]